jgi:TonB family protein
MNKALVESGAFLSRAICALSEREHCDFVSSYSGGCFMKIKHPFEVRSARCSAARLVFALLAVTAIFWPRNAIGQQQSLPKLTLSQIEQLVSHGVPDSTMAVQIQKRGVAFTATPANLDELRAKGAGPLTLAAIQTAASSVPATHKTSETPQPEGPGVQPGRNWNVDTPFPLPAGVSLGELRADEIWEGRQYGLGSVPVFGRNAAVFTAANSSRIEYGPYITDQGTLELWIKVNHGYRYDNYQFKDNLDEAIIFSSDRSGGDVTWPGTTKLIVNASGDITLWMAIAKYNQPPAQATVAKGTAFRFGEWHAIAISYGSQGQWIMLDGKVVAASPSLTQTLGKAGNHQQPLDVPGIGETACHFWDHHRYEGGFDGVVAGVRLSTRQKDWALALTAPANASNGSPSEASPAPMETDGVYRVGGAISAPVILHSAEAEYTDEARRAHLQGNCLISLVVDAQGMPQDLQVVRSLDKGLDEKAIEAVKKYRFKPAMRNGITPVPVRVTVQIGFQLY